MKPVAVVLSLAVLTTAAGAAALALPRLAPASGAPADTPTLVAPAAASEERAVEWKGYIRAGPADMLAHTKETEPIVAPLARMGFDVQVPEGTTLLRLHLAWPAGTPMHVMTHAPAQGMPTYMSGWPDTGKACLQIPAAEIVPGTWKVMAHADEKAVALDFTVRVEYVATMEARVLDDVHGHPMMEDMRMDMREAEACE